MVILVTGPCPSLAGGEPDGVCGKDFGQLGQKVVLYYHGWLVSDQSLITPGGKVNHTSMNVIIIIITRALLKTLLIQTPHLLSNSLCTYNASCK